MHLRTLLTTLLLSACVALAACGSSSSSSSSSGSSTPSSGGSSSGGVANVVAQCANQAGTDSTKLMTCFATHGMTLDPSKVTACLGNGGGASAVIDCLKSAAVSAK